MAIAAAPGQKTLLPLVSGSHQGDLLSGGSVRFVDAGPLVDWREIWAAVENDEGTDLQAEPVEIAVELVKSLCAGIGLAGAADLEFEGLPLLAGLAVQVAVWPADEQVEPAAADAVLAVDVAAAIHHSVQ